MSAPDLQQKVVGFRQFRLAPKRVGEGTRLRLHSASAPYIWKPGINKAECLGFHEHSAPYHGCACGLYGFHRTGEAFNSHLPWAIIQAWGKMEVHRSGFRAEFAEVVLLGLDTPPGMFPAYDQLCADYNVSTVSLAKLSETSKQFGSPVPESLLPSRKVGEGKSTAPGRQAFVAKLQAEAENMMKQQEQRR